MGYEESIATKHVATSCVFCRRPLVDAESIERGCGPECADKYGTDFDPGPVDHAKIEAGLGAAPATMREDLAPYLTQGDFKGAVQRAIWHAAVAAEYGGAGAKEVIASAHTVAQGAGYDRTANQIVKMHLAKSAIRLVRQGGQIGVITPYQPSFVSAIKAVPGRRFERHPEPAWWVPEDRLPEAINALSVAFPGVLALGADGNLFAIPMLPVVLLPPVTKPVGAPEYETQEAGPKRPKVLSDLKKGDIVVDPKGQQREVGWIGEKNGDPRVGLVLVKGQRGYEFFSYSHVTYLPADALAEFQRDQRESQVHDARALGADPEPELPKVERRIPSQMFPFQIAGVRWLDAVGSGLLGDDMGLGKTLQAIVALDAPALVICPATLRVNWAREVGRWRPELSTQIIEGTKPIAASLIKADVVIVNYDIASKHYDALATRAWGTLVVDEAQAIKTLQAKKDTKPPYEIVYKGSARAIATVRLGARARRRFLLTGTPVLNRTCELWPLLYLLNPRAWDNFFGFAKRYCAAFQGRFGWDFSGSSNEQELHEKLTGKFMLRRMKTEVLADLPEKSRESIVVTLSEAAGKVYRRAAEEFLAWVAEEAGPSVAAQSKAVAASLRAKALTKMTALRRLAAEGKVEAALEWISTHHESTGRPLVVMGHHASALEPLVGACRDAKLRTGTVLGGEGQSGRQKSIDAFQAGELDVIVCSIMAAGVGITLTAAQEMLFIERAWRPSDLVQCEDRIYRIGQKNAVQITYMDGAGTVDAAIANLLKDKVVTIAAVVDGKALSESDATDAVMGALFGEVRASANPPGAQGAIWPEPAFNWLDPAEG